MKQLQLQLIDLDGRDFRVYKTLLQLGASSVRAIAHSCSINRGSTYESLKKLATKGLVSFQQHTEKTKRYVAEDPQRLNDLVRERELELLMLGSQLKPHLAFLEKNKDHSFSLPTRLYEGDEGVAAILRDVLATTAKQPEKTYRTISSQKVSDNLYRRFKNYTAQRVKNNISVKVLSADGGDEADFAERRILKSDDLTLHAYTIIYGTKTAIISITDLNIPHGLVIDDPSITNTQKTLFDLLWLQAK